MKKVTDWADDLTYTGAMDFKDGADKAVEYAYDANGNMTSDLNRGIVSITYNQLNLPQSVLFKDGHESRYTYAADGRDYCGSYIYKNGRLERMPTAGGYMQDGELYLYIKDYQGNVRKLFKKP